MDINIKKGLSEDDKSLIKRLFRDNFKKHALLYVKAICAVLVVSLMTSASAWIMRDMVNSLVVFADLTKVFQVATMVATIFIIKGFATFFQIYYLSRAGNSIIAEQQRKIYDRLLAQGVSFFQKNAASDLLVRITHSAQGARSLIDMIVTTYIRDLVSVIGLLTVMLIQNYQLTLLSLLIGPAAFLCVRVILKKVKGLMVKEMASLGEIIKVIQETTIGVRVIKAFALEDKMAGRMNKAITDVQRRANAIARLQAATNPVMETLAGIAIAIVIAFSGVQVIEYGGRPGELMSFIAALLLAYEPAKRLANSRVKLETDMVGVRMMFEILDQPITLVESPQAHDLVVKKGEIVFSGVSFAYSESKSVLHDINLKIPAGKMTALVGPSGAGKSTMINLMMRLYDPVEGRIEIDGQDIKQATFKSLRHALSYVGQDTFLFSGSVMHNIGLGLEGASEEAVIEAAKNANAHDFIMELEDGYETDIGENGSKLSGGQRQRLAIARAMLRGSEILILDEATSALDSESEAAIQQALGRLTQGRTTIVIAHRLSTIAMADQIVVMQAGRIAELGTQNQLLTIEDGLYRRLYNLQFRGQTGDSDLVVEEEWID